MSYWWPRILVGLLIVVVAATIVTAGPFPLATLPFRATMAWVRTAQLARVGGDQRLDSRHFLVYYPSGEQATAARVAAQGEAAWSDWSSQLGQVGGAMPAGPVAVILVPNEKTLQATLGWSGGSGLDASGVYWDGVIYLVAQDRPLPVAHEFTHWFLAMESGGSVPRWLSEGLAQWEQARVTGYVWRDPAGNPATHAPYTIAQLDSFGSLDNQALAYRESLALVQTLAARGGPLAPARLVAGLANGESADGAAEAASGSTWAGLWQSWLATVAALPARP